MPPPHPSRAPLTAVEGFCELGMWQAAWEELETLPAEDQEDPTALLHRDAAVLAEGMLAGELRYDLTFLLGAYAIPRDRSTEEARDFLLLGKRELGRKSGWRLNFSFARRSIVFRSLRPR
jgi:hypothetical protein